jgi:fructooligosaccharide transport system permease protein
MRTKVFKGDITFTIFKYAVLIVLGILFTFPTWWMVINSFRSQPEILANMDSVRTFLPTFNPSQMFDSYINLFNAFDLFFRALLNSILYATLMIIGVLVVNSFAGYALSRFRFPGANIYVTIIILILIIPVEASVVPLYVIIFRLGLLDTQGLLGEHTRVIAYLIPGIVGPFNIFMFRQFFLGIPTELEEAAKIDGATKLQTYFYVIVPVSKAVFATVAVFTFMGIWNDFLWPQLIFTNQRQFPLQVFLQVVNNFNPPDMGMVLASLTISTIPIAIVYIFAQKYIVEGVAFTGLK